MTDYIASGEDLTSVASAIRAKGGTSAQLSFPNGFVSAIGDISTGDGNAIAGTFTTGSVAGQSQTVEIPYSGSGYPIGLLLFPSIGTTYQQAVYGGKVLLLAIGKLDANIAPSYSASASNDRANIRYCYLSTSGSGTGSGGTEGSYNFYAQGDATANVFLKISSNKQIKLYISDGTIVGFPPTEEYVYAILYRE